MDEHTGEPKVLVSKNIRIILTRSGKVFVSGFSFSDVMTLADPSCYGETEEDNAPVLTSFCEVDLAATFANKVNNDRIIDIAIGSGTKEGMEPDGNNNTLAIVTESGKVYGRGAALFGIFRF